ncbi:MAG: molybdopterin-dependent oxidoreductase, partial [Chloroflexi bacterium]|nr:molybdopterin-dependent oxidoreductase [Chloroflexota bacterium]
MSELSVVGQSVKRLDSFEKVTGKAKYVMDMKLPGMLYGKILRSPYPHAKILRIDTSQAEQLPGVKAVLTAGDLPDKLHGAGLSDEPTLARDKVRFTGEAVAAVAADSLEIAEEALGFIEVEYEELPPVFDAEEAMKRNPAVVIHPDLFNYDCAPVVPPKLDLDRPNVYNHYKIRHGDMEVGFRQADLTMENRFSVPMIQHCQFEPHVSIAQVETDGTITVWSSAQTIYGIKQMLCDALDVSSSKVRVIVPYVGGGFGGKVEIKT